MMFVRGGGGGGLSVCLCVLTSRMLETMLWLEASSEEPLGRKQRFACTVKTAPRKQPGIYRSLFTGLTQDRGLSSACKVKVQCHEVQQATRLLEHIQRDQHGLHVQLRHEFQPAPRLLGHLEGHEHGEHVSWCLGFQPAPRLLEHIKGDRHECHVPVY